jgi:hypothetical protein
MLGSSQAAAQLAASQEGLSSISERVSDMSFCQIFYCCCAVSDIYYETIRQDNTPNFHTLKYTCYSFESKHAHAVANICSRVTTVKIMAVSLL